MQPNRLNSYGGLNLQALFTDVDKEQDKVKTKFDVFKNLHNHLEKIATTIEIAVQSVKLNAADYRKYGFGPYDFKKLCDIYKFKIE